VLFIVRAVDDFGYIAGDLTDDEVPVAAAISVSGDKDQFTFPPELAPALAWHSSADTEAPAHRFAAPWIDQARLELVECVVESGRLFGRATQKFARTFFSRFPLGRTTLFVGSRLCERRSLPLLSFTPLLLATFLPSRASSLVLVALGLERAIGELTISETNSFPPQRPSPPRLFVPVKCVRAVELGCEALVIRTVSRPTRISPR
jgi:hypothetical protein